MERKERSAFAAETRPAIRSSAARRLSEDAHTTLTVKTRIVEFRSGEAVHRHPDLMKWIREGWVIQSAAPYLGDSETVQLRVVLARDTATPAGRPPE